MMISAFSRLIFDNRIDVCPTTAPIVDGGPG